VWLALNLIRRSTPFFGGQCQSCLVRILKENILYEQAVTKCNFLWLESQEGPTLKPLSPASQPHRLNMHGDGQSCAPFALAPDFTEKDKLDVPPTLFKGPFWPHQLAKNQLPPLPGSPPRYRTTARPFRPLRPLQPWRSRIGQVRQTRVDLGYRLTFLQAKRSAPNFFLLTRKYRDLLVGPWIVSTSALLQLRSPKATSQPIARATSARGHNPTWATQHPSLTCRPILTCLLLICPGPTFLMPKPRYLAPLSALAIPAHNAINPTAAGGI
jgi:hypothetical protein